MASVLKKSGRDLDSLTPEDLLFFDEIHIGGKTATLNLAKKANLKPGDRVLDVGCGIGGPARTLAAEFGCRVFGIDISEEFCEIAKIVTQAVGLEDKVDFQFGDALDMPYPDDSFDIIWSQHCSMNIENKARLFFQFRRVLKKDGQLITHDIVSGAVQPMHFPVPWARNEEINFLIPADEQKKLLEQAGFKMSQWNEITVESIAWFHDQIKRSKTERKSPLHQFLIFGEDLRQMGPNILKNMMEKRISVVEGIWR